MTFGGEFQSQFPDKLPVTVSLEKVIKFGETVTDIATKQSLEDTTLEIERLSSYSYRRSDVSQLSWALERTDLSNPRQPYFDF